MVIAYDNRHKSAEFAQEAALTLAGQGIKAYIYPSLRSTPQLSYSVRKLDCAAGIMITASHNPPQYNGYKVYGADGAQLNLEDANKVLKEIDQIEDELTISVMPKQEAIKKGLYVELGEELDNQYIDYIYSLALQPELLKEEASSYPLVFTPLHGTAYEPVQKLLKKAGFTQVTYVPEQIKPDPEFSTVASPNPEEHAAFSLAIKYAQEVGAELVMGTDPDADRLGLVVKNNQGEYVVLTGNQTGALFLYYILGQLKARGELTPQHVVCKTIVTSELGRAIAQAYGVETMDTLTGFKFIGEKIKEFKEQGTHTFLFGYEESYGYLYGDEVRDKDAIQMVLLAAEMGLYYQRQGKTLYQVLEEIYQQYGYYKEDLVSITLEGVEGLTKIKHCMERLRQAPPQSVANLDVQVVEDYLEQERIHWPTQQKERLTLPSSNVLKYILAEDTWFCVRPSGTEPKLKIYVGTKADSLETAQKRVERIKQEVTRLIEASALTNCSSKEGFNMNLVEELQQFIDKERVTANPTMLAQHGRDESYHQECPPEVVVFPISTEEVSQIMRFAYRHRIPVTPFGLGTSLEGNAIPVQGGISIDFSQMNKILEIRPDDFLVRVQPGVTRTQLNKELKRYGLFFSVDPGADATLGGMASTNASGTTTVRYGGMRDQVRQLEVVLADGKVIRPGSLAAKSSAGYFLPALFVGSEGTLGLFTELTLKVHGIPEHSLAARASFPSAKQAIDAVVSILTAGIPIARVEFVDQQSIKQVNAFSETNYPEFPTLFLNFMVIRQV